jgi:hypothetical protein
MRNLEDDPGKVPCTVNISKTIQEYDFEPFVVEFQETRWVTEEAYGETHFEIYDTLMEKIDTVIKERLTIIEKRQAKAKEEAMKRRKRV